MTEIISKNTHTVVNVDGQIHITDGQILLQNKTNEELIYVPYSKEICTIFNIPHNNAETPSNSNKPTCDLAHDSDEEIENDTSDIKLWTRERVNFLIETVEEYMHRLDNGVKKNVWEKIAQVCASEFGKVITYKQVESKWKSLKRTYKSVIIHNDTSGKNRRYWEYFNKIHKFMHKRPEIIPEAIFSSSGGLQPRNDITSESNNSENNNNPSEEQTNVSESSFSKKRRQRESETSKRHKEKLARMDRFNDLFERMVEKM